MTNTENTPHRVVRIADDAIVGEAPSLVAAKHLRTQLFGNRVTAYRIEEVPDCDVCGGDGFTLQGACTICDAAERNLDGDLADRPTECCAAELAAQGSTITCGCDACEPLTPETIERKRPPWMPSAEQKKRADDAHAATLSAREERARTKGPCNHGREPRFCGTCAASDELTERSPADAQTPADRATQAAFKAAGVKL